ncbi:type II toxin-antitoxin system death-on-curing family toxin [Mobilicoccus caccae]|uniref:Fido domain-containing protein n=1 Tax=Mobilicoccus caccae TaxID=1859295 RepID=A0ABQ6IQK4_9MICO|nr:Fic family protein [Mobilicoccus caccae]GMA40167.1 hypothetical protein GCM10025883_22120 [Mobilicoccus caccae]
MNFHYLTVEDLAILAAELGVPDVRDSGLLDSAAQRPASTAFGEDAYPDLATKAAALMSSIARNHALVDGNKRLAWTATVALGDVNDHDLVPPSIDAAYELVIAASTGTADVDGIATILGRWLVAFPVLPPQDDPSDPVE